MSLNSSEAAEEIWKDDDFLSFAAAGGGGGGGGAAGDIDDQQDDEDQDDDDDAVASTPRSVNEQVEEEKFRCYDKSLPPWMNHRTDFRRVPPLVALHNEMVAFAALMSPMKKVSTVSRCDATVHTHTHTHTHTHVSLLLFCCCAVLWMLHIQGKIDFV